MKYYAFVIYRDDKRDFSSADISPIAGLVYYNLSTVDIEEDKNMSKSGHLEYFSDQFYTKFWYKGMDKKMFPANHSKRLKQCIVNIDIITKCSQAGEFDYASGRKGTDIKVYQIDPPKTHPASSTKCGYYKTATTDLSQNDLDLLKLSQNNN